MIEQTPDISVVVPVHDEQGAAGPLAREIAAAFAGRSYEMIFIDDASKDGTLAELRALMAELPALRVLSHQGAQLGQGAVLRGVVDEDHLVGPAGEGGGDLAGQRAGGALFVMHRDDDGDVGGLFDHGIAVAGFAARREGWLTRREGPC